MESTTYCESNIGPCGDDTGYFREMAGDEAVPEALGSKTSCPLGRSSGGSQSHTFPYRYLCPREWERVRTRVVHVQMAEETPRTGGATLYCFLSIAVNSMPILSTQGPFWSVFRLLAVPTGSSNCGRRYVDQRPRSTI